MLSNKALGSSVHLAQGLLTEIEVLLAEAELGRLFDQFVQVELVRRQVNVDDVLHDFCASALQLSNVDIGAEVDLFRLRRRCGNGILHWHFNLNLNIIVV